MEAVFESIPPQAPIDAYPGVSDHVYVPGTRRPEHWSGATRELSMTGSEVIRRLKVERSAISRAIQRVTRDLDLISATFTLLGPLEPSALSSNNWRILLVLLSACCVAPSVT